MDKNRKKRYHVFFFLVKKKNEDINVPRVHHGLSKRTKATIQICLLALVSVTWLTLSRHELQVYVPARDRKSAYLQYGGLEIHHIAFLKVYKAGSSTVQNILFRYGEKNNLTFIIPAHGNKFSIERHTHEVILDPLKGKHYDILAMHSFFNMSTYLRYLPKDTFFLGIVREPLSAMISGAYYHRDAWGVSYLQKVPKEDFIHNLITYPEMYDDKEFSLTRNTMAWVFGLPEGLHVQDTQNISHYLRELDRVFDFVMILEHFSESLVLLRRMLNWKLSDILYMPLNTRVYKPSMLEKVSDVDKRKFESRNFLDVALYNFFFESFMARLSNQTDDFFQEVKYFKNLQTRVELFCMVTTSNGTALVVNESRWNDRFLVGYADCLKMSMEELTFVEGLRMRHLEQLYKNL